MLLVEDDPDARELVAHLLGGEGAFVYQADGSMSALAVLAMHTPDVLISDIATPDADGYWLLERVRALGSHRKSSTPAIAVTAFTRDADRRARWQRDLTATCQSR